MLQLKNSYVRVQFHNYPEVKECLKERTGINPEIKDFTSSKFKVE